MSISLQACVDGQRNIATEELAGKGPREFAAAAASTSRELMRVVCALGTRMPRKVVSRPTP